MWYKNDVYKMNQCGWKFDVGLKRLDFGDHGVLKVTL